MKTYLFRKSSIITQFEWMQKALTPPVIALLIILSFFIGKYSGSSYEIFNNTNVEDTIFDNNSEEYELNSQNAEIPQDDLTDKLIVSKGDTISDILHNQNLPKNDIVKIIQLADQEKISSKLKIGQEIIFEYKLLTNSADEALGDQSDNDKMSLAVDDSETLKEDALNRKLYKMSVSIDELKSVDFVREEGEEEFTIQYSSTELKKLVTKYETTIENSLVESLNNEGLSNNAIIKLINTYSHQIDFQRQIKSGDKITVIAEKYMTEDDKFSHHGKILYSTLTTGGREYEIYLYSPDGDDDMQYFNAEGRSIKSSLLKTPVNATRISGHYGYRHKHPVLGYGRMHKGVDFAAPTGTPIYAAGDGVIEFVGQKSGYGNFVIVKHNKELSTAYAHATKFPNGIKKGKRVKQGETIAYVGSTGTATGPHLHFEVLVNNKQVNPMSYKSEPGIKLAGRQLEDFKNFKTQISSLSGNLSTGIELAEMEFKNSLKNKS